MGWSLIAPTSPGSEPETYQLRLNSTAYIVLSSVGPSVGVVHQLHPDLHTELGRITVGPWGAKLEAISTPLSIVSGQIHAFNPSVAIDSRGDKYELQPRSDERSEIILLRHGDVIRSSKVTTSLTCKWEQSSEVQVNSSAVETSTKNATKGANGVVETTEEEAEDEDIGNTTTTVKATQSKSEQPRATPQLSNQRSIVIQETPTAARVNGATDYLGKPETENETPRPLETTPTPETPAQLGEAPFSTAHIGQLQNATSPGVGEKELQAQSHLTDDDASPLLNPPLLDTAEATNAAPQNGIHPKVVISRKRPSPAIQEPESENETVGRSGKRARRMVPSDNDTQDSRMSNIVVDTSPAPVTAKKGRKRKSAFMEHEEPTEKTPSRSQRSSQRSVSVQDAGAYSGDTPRVATSNSSITDKSQAVKFLKKQGGCLVDSIKEPFNVLCVRDGDLHKTPKILQAIATGTPIVIDKWLTDSAKIGHFLSVDAYRPSAPKQEKEWGFKLADVIGQPQTPFKGYTLHFTTSAHAIYKPFTEIEQICKAAGAEKVTKKKLDKSDNVIVLATEEGDKDAEKLTQDGVTCYYRDILPKSIFRGNCDLESDEFKVGASNEVAASAAKETRPKRGRKS